ncbi:MAG TPA: hypothetical protein DD390_08625, partial [Rhodospirillaceae bacterium]|nr:hypothetical protein [Rhodospirillaceae bacterium]
GYWELYDAYISVPDEATRHVDVYRLATELTIEGIQDSFASADTLSFWELPKFISSMEQAGFNANAHRLYLNSLLSMPVLLCAMVLIAAIFSIRVSRRSSTGMMIIGGVISGFLLYFFHQYRPCIGHVRQHPRRPGGMDARRCCHDVGHYGLVASWRTGDGEPYVIYPSTCAADLSVCGWVWPICGPSPVPVTANSPEHG